MSPPPGWPGCWQAPSACRSHRSPRLSPPTSRPPRRPRATAPAATTGTPIYVATATGVVDNVLAGYIEEAVKRAAADGAAALVIQLNTPGGSLDCDPTIVSSLLELPRAGRRLGRAERRPGRSAGTFITLAANLASWRRGPTSVPPRRSASSGAGLAGTIGEKVKNDAIANIRSIAEHRGRNVDWAVTTVDKAIVVAGHRGRLGRRGRRHRRVARRRPRLDRWQAGHVTGRPTVTLALAGAVRRRSR